MFHVKHLEGIMVEAVLFDFNGTLYFDADINHDSWKEIIDEISDHKIDFEEFFKIYRSTKDSIVIRAACDWIGKEMSDDEVEYYVQKKEELYRSIGINNHRTVLPEGAKEFMDYIQDKKIPMNLATSSIIENVNFYFDAFKIDRWFDFNKIAYDDGTYTSKVKMYQDCAKRVGASIENCIVIEDSPTGVKDAIEAGCKGVIIINSSNLEFSHDKIIQIVHAFDEIDRSVLD